MAENYDILDFKSYDYASKTSLGGPSKPEQIPHVFEKPVQVFGRERVIDPFRKIRKSWAHRTLVIDSLIDTLFN